MHVLGTHVDETGIAKTGGNRCGCHTVLAGAGLGDQPGFAHAFGQQDLAQAIVDLVSCRCGSARRA